jgi:hypothetical protein
VIHIPNILELNVFRHRRAARRSHKELFQLLVCSLIPIMSDDSSMNPFIPLNCNSHTAAECKIFILLALSTDWQRARMLGGLHESLDADRNKYFHREPRGCRLLCDTPVLASDRCVGRHGDLVPRRSAVQSRDLLPGLLLLCVCSARYHFPLACSCQSAELFVYTAKMRDQLRAITCQKTAARNPLEA